MQEKRLNHVSSLEEEKIFFFILVFLKTSFRAMAVMRMTSCENAYIFMMGFSRI